MINTLFLRSSLTISYILIIVFSINAQNYLNETSKWYVVSGDYFSDSYQISNLEIVGDTIIKENSYKKIQVTTSYYKLEIVQVYDTIEYAPEVISYEFVREDAKKFYRWINNADKLFADFDLKIGDEISGRFNNEKIESIDSFILNGGYRKIFHTEGEGEIFEGIGTEYGLFEGLEIIGDQYFSFIRCFHQDGETFKINGRSTPLAADSRECGRVFLTTSIENEEKEDDVNIYPTIAEESILIDLKLGRKCKILLLNSVGKVINRFQFSHVEEKIINVENLANGIYFLQIDIGEKIYVRKMIKK